jgi:hypothetical protein
MSWLGAGTGAAAEGVTVGVGGLPAEGDPGCSGSERPGAGTSGAREGKLGGSVAQDAAEGKVFEGAAAIEKNAQSGCHGRRLS